MEVSAPAWDTKHSKQIFAITPKYSEYALQFKIFDHKLQDKSEDKNDQYDSNERYTCLECDEFLIPHRGEKIRWHFQHRNDNECSFDKFFSINNESDIHKLAKYKLSELLKVKFPIMIISPNCIKKDCSTKLSSHDLVYKEGDKVKIEYIIDKDTKTRADVAIINNNEIRYIFEVCHTNKTKSERPDPWFEIRASEILKYNTSIDTIILKDIKDYDCKLCKPCLQIILNCKPIILESQCNKNNLNGSINMESSINCLNTNKIVTEKTENLSVTLSTKSAPKQKGPNYQSYQKKTIRDLAIELGYLCVGDYPYSCKARELMDKAMKGKYKIATESWFLKYDDDLDKEYVNTLMRSLLWYKECIRCEKAHQTIWGKPFCDLCRDQTKKDKYRDCENALIAIDNKYKFTLRDKFKWLADVPGNWSNGTKCFFCNENYIDFDINEKYQKFWEPNSNYVNGYVWYFGEDKCCCTVCLDKQCKDRKIV